ncbi:hypothetical protein [Streptomyces avidinii]|uniref:Uncharacterized protein n=1 Tax=Streptomyces avidinii TaxID=1895 RepID=A0ABS4LFG1_STRAV|nr:hypothetical protein [Streptomyces avidinii]MBP2040862.1 hypothetical protein [Streptomyces avidinii]GGZ15456.1 hypothetical protein GCM10010343_47850 [Streptomyces avidinii]
MRSKLAGLIGIIAAALAFGVGVTVSSPADAGQPAGYQVLADDKGPGVASPAPTPAPSRR